MTALFVRARGPLMTPLSDQIHGKTAQPVTAFIMSAGDRGESGAAVSFSRRGKRGPAPIVGRER